MLLIVMKRFLLSVISFFTYIQLNKISVIRCNWDCDILQITLHSNLLHYSQTNNFSKI